MMYKQTCPLALLFVSTTFGLVSHVLAAGSTTAFAAFSSALAKAATRLQDQSEGFFSPLDGGGSQLDFAVPGAGEPMNVIISGLSSRDVLTDDGFLNWAQSVQMSFECLGLHLGGPQSANLGDGNGPVNQTVELRQDFGNSELGTCLESLIGGNHLRMFRQNGTLANSGALFLAVSKEENVKKGHNIVPNGYDIGRDLLVASALNKGGTTSFEGVKYKTTSKNITGLLQPGSNGVNHGISIDGVVVLLTIQIVH